MKGAHRERNSMAGKKEKIIYGILAVLVFAVLFGVTRLAGKNSALSRDEEKEQTYDMVVLGDSIFGHVTDETSIPYLVAEGLGINGFNAALGGTCATRLVETLEQREIRDALSLVSLSKSMAARDFQMQKLVNLRENGTWHFPEIIEQLSRIDLGEVELLLIGHGVNDYHAGTPIENKENIYDEYTYTGAIRSAVRTLQNAYPDMRIVLVTAPYTWYTNEGLSCEEYVLGGNVLEDYVNAETEVAEELGVEMIDLYHDVFPHATYEDWTLYSVDGLHPNEEGRKLLAQIIIDYLVGE